MNSLDVKDIWGNYTLRNKEEITILKGLNLTALHGEVITDLEATKRLDITSNLFVLQQD